MGWIDAAALSELDHRDRIVVRLGGRQILVVRAGERIHAVPNRCPHEGYPLSEGVLDQGCVLTCHWHNWKFDLESGATLIGGDRLAPLPVRIEGGRILLDVSPPDPAARRRQVLANVEAALDEVDEQRLVRETARLASLGADPVDAVRTALAWTADRLKYGTTHAIAGAPDWLALHDRASEGSAERLVALGEILGHLAEDSLFGRGRHPFPAGEAPWHPADFLAAIEAGDEGNAARLVRGALAAGLAADDLAPVLIEAALAHYADFGHSLIYTTQTLALIRRLGAGSAEPLLLSLVRAHVYATREDLLPEFRDYAARMAGWGSPGETAPFEAACLRRTSARSALAITAGWSRDRSPEAIFAVLVEAAAWILLQVDEAWVTRADARLADSVGWLDFTHALTFAEAGAEAARLRPDLWPAVLLQLACFIGRNAGYVDADRDTVRHRADDPAAIVERCTQALFDHGQGRFIVSVHLLKTLRAGAALIDALPAQAPVLAAALDRLFTARVKSRHILRTARQMQALVAEE